MQRTPSPQMEKESGSGIYLERDFEDSERSEILESFKHLKNGTEAHQNILPQWNEWGHSP